MVPPQDGAPRKTGPDVKRLGVSDLRRSLKQAGPRLLVLNGRGQKLPLQEDLTTLGYDVVGSADSPDQVFALAANLLPDAVLVFLDSLERASALLAMRVLGHRYTCAIVVLAQRLDRAMLAQLKLVSPHAVAHLPVPTEILDATIHSALDAAAQRKEARLARLRAGSESGPVPAGFDSHFNLAVGRALRNGTTFAAGLIDFVMDEYADRSASEVAVEAVERLQAQLRQYDVVQRRSDGTLVFLAEEVGANELEALGERVLRALSNSRRKPHEQLDAWPAIGMALWSAPGQDHHGLLHAAEEAMAEAKAAGGACWRIAHHDRMQTPAIGNGAEKDDPAPAPEKQRRPLAIVQRSIGWISLGVLLWVAANYAGIGTAEKLAMQTNRVISYVMSLR